MSGRDIGVVVVGTGWGTLTHVPSLQRTGFDIKALVGTDQQRTQRRADASGIARAMTDYEAALELPGVEAAIIVTPPETHVSLALTAIAHGKHVLCEKPFATRLGDAVAMLEAARAAGVVHVVGHEMRWLPHQAAMAAAIREGSIGTPTFATYLKCNGVVAGPDATVPDWFGRRDSFGGWLNAEVQHMIDEVRMSLGDIRSVNALETSATSHEWDATESFAVQFESIGGAVGIIQSSIGSFGPPIAVTRVAGTEGTMWATPESEVFRVVGSGDTEKVQPDSALAVGEELSAPVEAHGESTLARALARATRFSKPTQHLHTAFRNRILGLASPPDWPPLPTFEDGVANAAVHDAILRSIATRTTCAVNPALQ
ncbi:Gfo/Idh/MocA family protein [Nocardia neocaledoniensis]|uniref:Gfo/Idh/MocA family protein n=1 Tax=Nocardia neocaledoniensis TaxID=236511 RepID=UPI002455EDD8|nr:Gfo/Idh/MocA family oxidoreductase [Nocardia neocaledoniensis]